MFSFITVFVVVVVTVIVVIVFRCVVDLCDGADSICCLWNACIVQIV